MYKFFVFIQLTVQDDILQIMEPESRPEHSADRGKRFIDFEQNEETIKISGSCTGVRFKDVSFFNLTNTYNYTVRLSRRKNLLENDDICRRTIDLVDRAFYKLDITIKSDKI